MPPGNYSGICSLGADRYAVVSDKADEDGFYVFHMDIDTLRGRIKTLEYLDYRSAMRPNRDMEGIAYCPDRQTVFVSGESDNEVYEYQLDGVPTGRRLALPASYANGMSHNFGLESLAYSSKHHLFFTTTERPLSGDSLHRILLFGDDLQLRGEYLYETDAPISRKYQVGISDLCALSDGRLLVLERQIRIPRLKVGARCVARIYEAIPVDGCLMQKRLLHEVKTRLTLTSRRFANYEGICQVGGGWLLLIADSQNRYKHVLHDWMLLLPLE